MAYQVSSQVDIYDVMHYPDPCTPHSAPLLATVITCRTVNCALFMLSTLSEYDFNVSIIIIIHCITKLLHLFAELIMLN